MDIKLTAVRRELILRKYAEDYAHKQQAIKDKHDKFSEGKFKFTLEGLVDQMSNKKAKELMGEIVHHFKTSPNWLSPTALLQLTDKWKADNEEVQFSREQADRALELLERCYCKARATLEAALIMQDTISVRQLEKLTDKTFVKSLMMHV